MTYRDDLEAARHHRDNLSQALTSIRSQLGDRDALRARERELAAALVAAERDIDQVRSRGALPLLRQVTIASPCPASWADMVGNDRVRHCTLCDKNVYDLSAMTAVEAETLLGSKSEGMCARFYRRADGTVMTSDCPDGARRKKRLRRSAMIAAALLVGSTAAGVATRLAWKHEAEKVKPMAYGGGISYPTQPHQEMATMGGTGAPPVLPYEPEPVEAPAPTEATFLGE